MRVAETGVEKDNTPEPTEAFCELGLKSLHCVHGQVRQTGGQLFGRKNSRAVVSAECVAKPDDKSRYHRRISSRSR